jgi:FkbM family methyltransferase
MPGGAMTMLTGLKYWWRSGSPRFAADRHAAAQARPVSTYRWHDKAIHYRPGTSDTELIYKILLKPGRKAEYAFPAQLDPRVILDIGANIGVASVFLAQSFPQARIYAFEPAPVNVELLRLNAAACPGVTVLPIALGAVDSDVEMYFSDSPNNYGGFSLSTQGSDLNRKLRVSQRNIQAVLDELAVDRVDLIKIDTEGAEYDILTALREDVLARVACITGELHGQRDFELLAYLSRWFDIGAKKTLGKRLFTFMAVNKQAPH